MSEEKNIPEEKPSAIGNEPSPVSSEEPAGKDTSITPSQDTKPSTENMEVHKHPHHVMHTKKWSEFLLEFLMIFLAVFLGFVAENIREHIVEQNRATQYAKLLIADLKNDTAYFNFEKKFRAKQQPKFDTLIHLLVQPVPASNARVLKYLLRINYVSDAKMNTATYNQMKTSGALRYINHQKLSTALKEYYEIQLPLAVENSTATKMFFNEYIKTFFIDHLRNQDMDGPPHGVTMKEWNPVIFGRTAATDQRLSNIIAMDRIHLGITSDYYESADKKARELIALIKRVYHFDEDSDTDL